MKDIKNIVLSDNRALFHDIFNQREEKFEFHGARNLKFEWQHLIDRCLSQTENFYARCCD